MILPGHEHPLNEPDEVRDALEREIELVIGGGACSLEPTTVVDLTGDEPVLVRQGRGDVSPFGLTAG